MIKWAIRGSLARSSRPGYFFGRGPVDRATVDGWLGKARDLGIRSIICLLAEEHLKLYQDLPAGCGLTSYYQTQGFDVAHIPVRDHQKPPLSNDDLQQVVAAYERLPKPVLIHCSAGVDRTGQAISFLAERHHESGRESPGKHEPIRS